MSSGGFFQLLNRMDEEKKKEEELKQRQAMSDAIMADAKERGRISQEDYNKYLGGSQQQQVSQAFTVQAMEKEAMDRRYRAAQIQQMERSGEQFQPQAIVVPDPVTGQRQTFYTQSRGSVAPMPGGDRAASGPKDLRELDQNVQMLSGGTINDWSRAGNLVEDKASGKVTASVDVIDEKTGSKMGTKQLSMRIPEYQQVVQQYQRLTGQAHSVSAQDALTGPGVTLQGAAQQQQPAGQPSDLKALARKALDDPKATEEQKRAARRILGQ